ncbi:MAG: NB-ARC domain-containing protein [Cyanobacteria bacterium P01_D01_bin.14]
MQEDAALQLVRQLFAAEPLSDLQEAVFCQSWQGMAYPAMAKQLGYDQGYVRGVGYQLWQSLSDKCGQPVTKKNFKSVLEQYAQRHPALDSTPTGVDNDPSSTHHQDWGDCPDATAFYGRDTEMAQLQRWIIGDRCRLVGVFGIGGIGKTALASRTAQRLQTEFQYVVWRSLRNAPKLNPLLADLIQFLSDQQDIELRLPFDEIDRIAHLVGYLRRYRCLLVLDNGESILQGGQQCGRYRPGYEAYGDLLRQVGDQPHQSCLLLTSREKPRVFSRLEGETLPVRSQSLTGLAQTAGRTIIEQKGAFSATAENWESLVDVYVGNPLALKIVGAAIQDVFNGDVGRFLDNAVYAFDDISDLLDEQFNRLSRLEQQVMYWLSIEREPISIEVLQADILQSIPKQRLFEAVKSLVRRSLIEKSDDSFTQQPVVMEYLVERMRRQVQREIVTDTPDLLLSHSLMKGQSKDYIKTSQQQVLVDPILQQLLDELGNLSAVEQKLQNLLSVLREQMSGRVGYGAGNILSLAQGLGRDLGGYNFSELPLRQADLQMTALQGVNLQGAVLEDTVFSNSLDYNLTVTFHPNQPILAVGGSEGTIALWTYPEMQTHRVLEGHRQWVDGLLFSPDGRLLVSAGADYLIKVWDVATGKCLATLEAFQGGLHVDIALSPDGQTLVGVGPSGDLAFWDMETWQCLHTIPETGQLVSTLAFSLDGQVLVVGQLDGGMIFYNLATGERTKSSDRHAAYGFSMRAHPDGDRVVTCSHDGTVRLWDIKTTRCLNVLAGHQGEVSGIACHPDGDLLASVSHDRTVRLWDANSGQCLKVLQGHQANVWDVAFSPDGEILATVSFDHTIRLWETRTGRSLKTVKGSYLAIWDVMFSPDGKTLISGGEDRKLRFWNLEQAKESGQATTVFEAHSNEVSALALHDQGALLASGGGDGQLRLWNDIGEQNARTLTGYNEWVWAIAFSPDGQQVAAAGHGLHVCIWDVATGECCHRIQGEPSHILVWTVDFSADGQLLATGSYDRLIRLWDTQTWEQVGVLTGHEGYVTTVTFSPHTPIMVSGSYDCTVKIWNVESRTCLHTLTGHQAVIWSVAFSLDGKRIASASFDGMVKVWDVETGDCLQTLVHPGGYATSARFHPTDNRLASCYRDGNIRLWDLDTGDCELVLSPPKLYEGLDITGVSGLTPSQRESLLALGAVERV